MITAHRIAFRILLQISICICVILGVRTPVFLQQVDVNKGKHIIKYPDGSWRPIQPKDSVLLKQYLLQNPGDIRKGQPRSDNPVRNQGEEYEYLRRQWADMYNSMLEEDKAVQNTFRTATNNQFKAAELLQTAKENKKLIESDHLSNLTDEYDHSVNQLRLAKLQQKEIKGLLKKSNKINNKPQSISQNKINQIRTSYTLYLSKYHRGAATFAPPPPPSTFQPPTSTEPVSTESKSNAKPDPSQPFDPKMIDKIPSAMNVYSYTSQPYVCLFDLDTLDKVSGTKRRELPPGLLFTHTDPDLRPFFKSKDLITCRASISGIGPYTYLSVEFQIASSHSKGNFGALTEGSMLRLKLMDGNLVSLYNLKSNVGRIDAYSGHTIFVGQYALGKTELKALRSGSLDQMRVVWTTGYEDYDIYHIDLLKDQLNCLMSKN